MESKLPPIEHVYKMLARKMLAVVDKRDANGRKPTRIWLDDV